MKRFTTFAVALAACASIPALQGAGATETHPTRNPPQAVHQNPELAAHVGDGDDENQQSKALAITNLDLDVAIDGDTAHTVVTANFANSGGSALKAISPSTCRRARWSQATRSTSATRWSTACWKAAITRKPSIRARRAAEWIQALPR